MGELDKFNKEREQSLLEMSKHVGLVKIGQDFINSSCNYNYSYNFDWLGVPIIQYPQDVLALQEIIWQTKPDIIIETGIARGGSIIFHASMLQLLGGDGKVIGIDIDIRKHNREVIENHPLAHLVQLVEGSSIDENTIAKVKQLVGDKKKIMVILDSNHTHEHVLKELKLYSPFVQKGMYLAVLDTVIEDMPDDYFPERPWGKGDNPKTAVHQFLKESDRFIIDKDVHNKLVITVAPDGYLKCVK